MNEQPNPVGGPSSEEGVGASRPRVPRLRFPIVLIVTFWTLYLIVTSIEKPYFYSFIYGMLSTALLTLLFLGWWWFNRSLRFLEKVIGFLFIFGGIWATGKFAHPSMTLISLWLMGFPLVVTATVLWIFLAKRDAIPSNRIACWAVVAGIWSCFLLVRTDGLDADLKSQLRWRWSPTAEERLLAETPSGPDQVKAPPPSLSPSALPSASEEWTGFRGPQRDGVARGIKIAEDWNQIAPAQVWKRLVGPSWSSVIVVGNRLYTQEQRGEEETAVCYDASTGEPLWIHEDAARFEEAVSGVGPRATPTFSMGRLVTLGGTGILNCLDAETGKRHWSRDIKTDSSGKTPMWGFASSPLIVDGHVVVYAGGEAGKSLLAYRLESGELAWTAAAGQNSYSSAQLTTIAGVPLCLMLTDFGLTAINPADGQALWETGLVAKGAPRYGQPRLMETNKLAVAGLDGTGVSLIEVSKDAEKWKIEKLWTSKDLKPEFPDFVIHGGHAYGFDISIFSCLDLSNGKRAWKEGRFGRGQVILLPDQSLLLVISESGEAILLAADPRGQKELGRFQAVQGKTWNHPVVAAGRLYLRNAEEMACYELSAAGQVRRED